MRPDKVPILITYIAISLIPFAIWGALWVARRVYAANLVPVLEWLRILRLIVWLIGLPLGLVTLVSDRLHWLFPIGISVLYLSLGLSFPQSWLKRHYAPEAPDSDDGWWPTART